MPYSPGVLKVVGIEDGKQKSTNILQTSGDAAKIGLKADRKEILANGQDLSYVSIELTDAKGIFQPNAANHLEFKIEGPGTIAGVANADMTDSDQYIGNSRKAWHGRALVIIRSSHKAGNIKLSVSSPGLLTSTVNIKALSGKSR